MTLSTSLPIPVGRAQEIVRRLHALLKIELPQGKSQCKTRTHVRNSTPQDITKIGDWQSSSQRADLRVAPVAWEPGNYRPLNLFFFLPETLSLLDTDRVVVVVVIVVMNEYHPAGSVCGGGRFLTGKPPPTNQPPPN